METMMAIARRKSVRAFKDEQLPKEILNTILSAGCAAPVGRAAYDSLHLSVIQDKEVLTTISKAVAGMMGSNADPLFNAPTLVLISAANEQLFQNIEHTNTGCIAENMMLAATDQGVGSVFLLGAAVAVAANAELNQAVKIPADFRPVGSVALGYPVQADDSEKELEVRIKVDYV